MYKYLIIGIVMIAMAGISGLLIVDKNSPKHFVYEVCQASRTNSKPYHPAEMTCGDLQDFYNVEYVCKERNSSTYNKCWVE